MEISVRRLFVEFFSSLSFSWIPCLLQNFFSLRYSSWIIKKCCDSQYDCESGAAALNCVVTFACFSLSSQCSPCLFSCFLTWFASQSVMVRPKISPWRGQEGGFSMMNTQKVVSALVYRARIIRLNLYSGQGAFHRGGQREGGIFFFPIMHQQQDPNWHRGLGSFSRDKHPVSRLTPSKGNLPATSIHHNTHARCLLKRNQRPKRPTHSSTCSWPATTASELTSSVFHAPSDSHGCQTWRANDSMALQKPQWLPWEKVTKTAAGRWKIHAVLPYIWVSPPHHLPLSFPLSFSCPPSLCLSFRLSFWMMHKWHQSVQHMGLGLFCLWSVGEF